MDPAVPAGGGATLPSDFLAFCRESGVGVAEFEHLGTLPRFVRFRRQRTAGAAERAALMAAHYPAAEAVPCVAGKTVWRLPHDEKIRRSPLYEAGQLAGIDLGSILAVAALDVSQPTHTVLDICCSPGAKLQLAAEQTEAWVTGLDVDPNRLATARKGLEKWYDSFGGAAAHVRLVLCDATLYDPRGFFLRRSPGEPGGTGPAAGGQQAPLSTAGDGGGESVPAKRKATGDSPRAEIAARATRPSEPARTEPRACDQQAPLSTAGDGGGESVPAKRKTTGDSRRAEIAARATRPSEPARTEPPACDQQAPAGASGDAGGASVPAKNEAPGGSPHAGNAARAARPSEPAGLRSGSSGVECAAAEDPATTAGQVEPSASNETRGQPPATSAPATSAPATSSPATSAPPTSAPATSAPATSSPATSAPATSAPATSSPATSTPATSAPATSGTPQAAAREPANLPETALLNPEDTARSAPAGEQSEQWIWWDRASKLPLVSVNPTRCRKKLAAAYPQAPRGMPGAGIVTRDFSPKARWEAALRETGTLGAGQGGGRPLAPAVHVERFDRVMVDAECTTDGSLRHVEKFVGDEAWGGRTPWAAPGAGGDLFRLQTALLRKGAELTRVGGILTYSTCSLARGQNEDVVAAVLSDGLLKPVSPFDNLEGGRSLSLIRDSLPKYVESDALPSIRFTPSASQCGGLFLAKFIRVDPGVEPQSKRLKRDVS
ncbi:Ribosomal RNA small subunit methyltransferase F [Diplonema papillatum]|nr:Ribosomal RNA small subunit methyltransferase F [Diplonema papillatum]